METSIVKLEDICNVSSSKRIFAREYAETGVPFWRGKEVTEHATGKDEMTGLFISEQRYEELINTGNIPSVDDVLITAVGTIGSVYQVKYDDLPFYFKDGNIIRLGNWVNKRVIPTYVCLYLRSNIGQQAIKEVEIGSTQKALTIKDVARILIPLPKIDIQKKIASIIETIDLKIQLNQQINNNLLQMMDLIWRHARKDRLTKLGDISNIRAGKRPIDRYEAFQEGLVPLVGGSGMMGWTSQSLVKTPIITTGRVGANIGTNGVTHMFDYPVWVSDNSLIITSNYLPVVFEMLRCDVDFSSLIHGTSQPLITQSDLKQYKVLLPDERRLNRINSYFLAITNLIEGNKAENRILSTVRDLMLPKLLAGDIDLSNIETVMNNA